MDIVSVRFPNRPANPAGDGILLPVRLALPYFGLNPLGLTQKSLESAFAEAQTRANLGFPDWFMWLRKPPRVPQEPINLDYFRGPGVDVPL
jgi:hypothetical protein